MKKPTKKEVYKALEISERANSELAVANHKNFMEKEKYCLLSMAHLKTITTMKSQATKIKNRLIKGLCGYCGEKMGNYQPIHIHLPMCEALHDKKESK